MPNFFFQRYVNGERMADDVLITKQSTLEAAIPEALRLCRNSPRSVLVHITDDSSLREENARLRADMPAQSAIVKLADQQAEIDRLREENEQLIEQLSIRSESAMAKDMQEIMRINETLREENARLIRENKVAFEAVGGVVKANDKLKEENARLLEALKPFAEVAKYGIGDDEADQDMFRPMLTHRRAPRLDVGHLRAAAAAAAIREGGE